jgi:AraC-like DNA-binding protein/quercetin dioxygenase-like cupin family protein
MKLEREHIAMLGESSFRAFRHDATTPCPVQWHYHPEFELVYLPSGQGLRHIGGHQSPYTGGELLLLGPNVPHLSYGFGQGPAFEEMGVHFPAELFSADLLARPELAPIGELLRRAAQGVVFPADVHHLVGPQVRQLLTLGPWERLMQLLSILRVLALASTVTELGAGLPVGAASPADQQRLQRVLARVEQQLVEPLRVAELAAEAALSVPAFCRFFKRLTQRTLTQFVNERRVARACRLLREMPTITQAAYASGFQNLAYFNRVFRQQMGESPSAYRRRLLTSEGSHLQPSSGPPSSSAYA